MSGDTTNNVSFPYTEFTPVKSRKKRRKIILNERDSLLSLVNRTRADLRRGDWLMQCLQIVEGALSSAALTAPDVLCLGLGSPSTSLNARLQLGFLLAMCETLEVDFARVSVYDPVFTEEDVSLFRELQLQVLSDNKSANYPLERPTICYMPHCDMELYENLLKANWSQDNLSNTLLVANTLMDYVESNPRHKLENSAPCLLNLAPMLQSRPLPVSTSWPTAFSNTSVQFVGVQTGS